MALMEAVMAMTLLDAVMAVPEAVVLAIAVRDATVVAGPWVAMGRL